MPEEFRRGPKIDRGDIIHIRRESESEVSRDHSTEYSKFGFSCADSTDTPLLQRAICKEALIC